MDTQFGRDEIRAVLERDAERILRFGAPLFGLLHLLEALSHSSEGLSRNVIVPVVCSGLLFGLSLFQRKSSAPLRYLSLLILIPWAVSIVSILMHISVHPQVSIAFVTLALMTSATLLLQVESFVVSLVGSLLAQIQTLRFMPDVHSSSLIMVPAFSLAIALLVYGSRRRALIAAERARFLERELHQKDAELVVISHERERLRLSSELQRQSVELQESRRSLEEHEHLAALGTVAAGVAHQINNPVGAILLVSDFAIMSGEEADAQSIQSEALRKIRVHAIRCGKIVRSLLKLSKGPSTLRESHELVACVESAIARVLEELPTKEEDIQLRVRPGVTGSCVFVNATELEEVFINLIRNGLQSKPSGACVQVEVALLGSQGIGVWVRDDGPGVDPVDVDRLFEPFFTNRLKEGGTGLGLSVAHRIVSDFGGRISHRSSEQRAAVAEDAGGTDFRGAEFEIWLPLEKRSG